MYYLLTFHIVVKTILSHRHKNYFLHFKVLEILFDKYKTKKRKLLKKKREFLNQYHTMIKQNYSICSEENAVKCQIQITNRKPFVNALNLLQSPLNISPWSLKSFNSQNEESRKVNKAQREEQQQQQQQKHAKQYLGFMLWSGPNLLYCINPLTS